MSNARGLSWVLRGTLGARSTFSAVRFQWVEARMDQVTARFKDQLFSSPDEIRILDQLAEWNRQHLDARYASAQLYNPRSRHLHVVAQREFASTLIGQFQDLPLTSGTVCARAGREPAKAYPGPRCHGGQRLDSIPEFLRGCRIWRRSFVPLLSRAGELIGVTSCHFAGRAKPTERGMNFARISCEFASDAIVELRRRQRQ